VGGGGEGGVPALQQGSVTGLKNGTSQKQFTILTFAYPPSQPSGVNNVIIGLPSTRP
jgi:hypothetical protein